MEGGHGSKGEADLQLRINLFDSSNQIDRNISFKCGGLGLSENCSGLMMVDAIDIRFPWIVLIFPSKKLESLLHNIGHGRIG